MNGFQHALQQACAMVGLDADGGRLLRLGSNAVYQPRTQVIARISRSGTDVASVRRSVAARWLEAVDYPGAHAIDVDQPVIVDGYMVTFWQCVSDCGDQFASTPEIAAILATLHQFTAPEGLHLPRRRVRQRRTAHRLGYVADSGRPAFFTATLTRLQDAYPRL